jgi:hypothetical protein
MLENFKEVVEALESTNESAISHRVNDVLRVLTAFSVIFLPLTLIASIFGMNVAFPGANVEAAFWVILGVMLVTLVGMVATSTGGFSRRASRARTSVYCVPAPSICSSVEAGRGATAPGRRGGPGLRATRGPTGPGPAAGEAAEEVAAARASALGRRRGSWTRGSVDSRTRHAAGLQDAAQLRDVAERHLRVGDVLEDDVLTAPSTSRRPPPRSASRRRRAAT